jgi:3-oxoacyl-(acyl-carrier-protein) synthase
VAVTGIGAVSGYGVGLDALWEGLASGRSAVRPHKARLGARAWLTFPMADLHDDTEALARDLPAQEFIRDNRLEKDRDLVVIAESIRQALADSGLPYDQDHNDVGIVVTHESPGLARHVQGFFRWGRMFQAWLRSRARFNPPEFLYEQQSESVYRMHSFLYLHYLSAIFRLHGFALFNNNACASGAFAMAVAADRIRSGETPAAVVAGGDVPEDGTKYRWFRDRGLYSPSGRCRPFETGRDGMVLGSGAAAFVLEDLEAARAAGRRVRAELVGSGFSSEGWKVTLPDVTGMRYRDAILRALAAAGLSPEALTLITPHGVGSGLYDRFEALTLAQVMGGQDGKRLWPPLMPLKGAIGHTLGGCALLETAASIAALERGTIPAAARCGEPDRALPLGPPRSDPLPDRWTFLKCTNGFAGQNAALIFRAPRD